MTNYEITIIISLFSLGLFGGFSHCIGMCGPFVLTQVNNRLTNIDINRATGFKKLQGIALIPYHLGRATTYSFIGGISSFLTYNLKEISEFKYLSAVMLIFAAMIFAGIASAEIRVKITKIALPFKINLVQNLYSSWLKNNIIFRQIKNLLGKLFLNPYNFKGYFLGILLGFIPCGLLYGAVISASALDNYLIAALGMFCFSMGTIPSLFITSCGGFWFFNLLQKRLKLFTKIILLLNSLTLFIMALGLIFNRI
jgi:uncharacterized protein